jgi:hypothetical protein
LIGEIIASLSQISQVDRAQDMTTPRMLETAILPPLMEDFSLLPEARWD